MRVRERHDPLEECLDGFVWLLRHGVELNVERAGIVQILEPIVVGWIFLPQGLRSSGAASIHPICRKNEFVQWQISRFGCEDDGPLPPHLLAIGPYPFP